MNKYAFAFKLTVQDIFQYRLNFLIHTTKYAMMVLMMTLVWLAVQQESGTIVMSRDQTIGYFAFAAILYNLSSFHTWYIEEDIKQGALIKYLLKPIRPFAYYLAHESANALSGTALKATIMLPILNSFGLLPSVDTSRFALFLLFLPVVFLYAFHQFFIVSSLAFWLREVYALRLTVLICSRFLAGVLVPLSFMPLIFQQIIHWLPFPHLIFTPIRLLQGAISLQQAFGSLAILVFWTVLLHFVAKLVWNLGAHSFESTGI